MVGPDFEVTADAFSVIRIEVVDDHCVFALVSIPPFVDDFWVEIVCGLFACACAFAGSWWSPEPPVVEALEVFLMPHMCHFDFLEVAKVGDVDLVVDGVEIPSNRRIARSLPSIFFHRPGIFRGTFAKFDVFVRNVRLFPGTVLKVLLVVSDGDGPSCT